MYLMALNCALKMIKIVNFVRYILQQLKSELKKKERIETQMGEGGDHADECG